jgi:hypothetical protein
MGRTRRTPRVIQDQQLYLNLQTRKAIQASAGALEMIYFPVWVTLLAILNKRFAKTIHLPPMPQPVECTIRAILADTGIRRFLTENKRLIHALAALLA